MTGPAEPPSILARLQAGELQGSTRLDLSGCGLRQLPAAVLALADTLEVLDLSGNALDTLPEGLAGLRRLHTLFASRNRFEALPAVLGRLPALDTLGLKSNRIVEVPAAALAPTLRWLILTDNRIEALPPTLGDCVGMQKLMLAGNRLRHLPAGIGRLQRLELLRIAANGFERAEDALPDDLLALPRLAWLAHAGNPFSAARERAAQALAARRPLPWQELELQRLLGEGASGQIHAACWRPGDGSARAVAVKLFKGSVTSDGLPSCEIAASLTAGDHPNLVGGLAALSGHPRGVQGLVLPLLPPGWRPLAGPPSMASCSRDVYPDGWRTPAAAARAIVRGASAAMEHLHQRGLTHGDLYAHNLLVDDGIGNGNRGRDGDRSGSGDEDGDEDEDRDRHDGTRLGDFGAASFLPTDDPARAAALRALDRRALDILRAELDERTA